MAISGLQQHLTQLPYSEYAQQRPRYTPDLESTILNMFGQYGVDVSRYGGGAYADPQARLARIANELKSGQRTFSDVERSLQLAASELSPEQRRAYQTAAYEFNPQWQQLNRALDQLSHNRTRDINAAQGYGQYGAEALQQVYDRLGQQFTQNRDAVNAAFQQAQQGTAQAFDQGRQIAQTANQTAQAQNAGLAASLGVREAVVDPAAELNSAVSQMLANSGTEQATAESVLNNLQSSLSGINTQAISDAGAEGALRQSQLATSVADMLGQIMGQYGQQTFDVLGNLNDLEASRGARTAELVNQFQDQSYDRRRQEALDQLAAEIQRGTLAIQQNELGLNAQQLQHQMGLDWANLGLDRQELELRRIQLQSEIATTTDPLRRRQLELENMLLEQELNGGTLTELGGQTGVNQFLDMIGASPTLRQQWEGFRTAAEHQAAMSGGDPLQILEYIAGQRSQGDPTLGNLLRQLGIIYYNS